MRRSLILLIAGLALTSCSGHSNLPAAAPSGDTTLPLAQPAVLSASSLKNLGRMAAPNVSGLVAYPRFLSNGHALNPLSSAGSGDLEQVGVAIGPGGPYKGLFATQTAYTNANLQIGQNTSSQLFAPLIVPSNNSCLGMGEVYAASSNTATSSFFVVDVCAQTIPFATPIDASFASNYTRIGARGVPQLLSLIYAPSPSTLWYALIYNYTAARWDVILTKTGTSGNGTGVSVWESEFAAGPCPTMPVIASDSMYEYNPTTNNFELMQPTMTSSTTQVFTTNPNCFLTDSSGPPSFAFAMSALNSAWGVASAPAPKQFTFGGSSATMNAVAGQTPALVSLSAYNNVSLSAQFGPASFGSGPLLFSDALNNGDVSPNTLPADNAAAGFVPVIYLSVYNGGTSDINFGTTTPAITLTKSTGFGGATSCNFDIFNNPGTGLQWSTFLNAAISGNTVTFAAVSIPGNSVDFFPGQQETAFACK